MRIGRPIVILVVAVLLAFFVHPALILLALLALFA